MPTAATKKRPAPSESGAGSVSGSQSAKKRKTDASNSQKFYAVRAGVKPGVYLTWPECQQQTAGFRGATYKSFTSRGDAEAFVAGQNPVVPTDPKKPQPEKFYAVATGSQTGIYTEWADASLALVGVKGPKYKKFGTRIEAVDFIKQFGNETAIAKLQAAGETVPTKSSVVKPGREKSKEGDGFLTIWTDGSALSNGKVGAVAGVGVWFGDKDPRNVSEHLEGEVQTNQRAELTAILRALQKVSADQNVVVKTDSQYSINCVTAWATSWEKKGWKTAQGEDVKNRDLVEAIRALLKIREQRKTQTVFKWLKGHSTDVGNNAADELAVSGAKNSKATKLKASKSRSRLADDRG